MKMNKESVENTNEKGKVEVIIIIEICKEPILRLKAQNKHTHIMYIEMENVIKKEVYIKCSSIIMQKMHTHTRTHARTHAHTHTHAHIHVLHWSSPWRHRLTLLRSLQWVLLLVPGAWHPVNGTVPPQDDHRHEEPVKQTTPYHFIIGTYLEQAAISVLAHNAHKEHIDITRDTVGSLPWS